MFNLPQIHGVETTDQQFRCGPFLRTMRWVTAVFTSLDSPTEGPIEPVRVDLVRFARPKGVWLDQREEPA